MEDGFTSTSERFLAWFKALPGATFHPSVSLEDLRGRNAGRGILATADIEPDTVLFTIPRKSILCVSTSELPSKLPDVFRTEEDDGGDDEDDEGGDARQDSWTSLILVLIYEHLRGAASPWKPYLDVLPAAFDTPMFWDEGELAELQASPVRRKVGRADADVMIRDKIVSVVRAHEDVFFAGTGATHLDDDALVALAHRMGSAIMAYAFDLEGEEGKDGQKNGENDDEEDDEWEEDREGRTMLGMVPMADILNADAQFNAHIHHGEDELTATALRPIRAGEEVLNYYGPLSNGELLRRYGYVTDHHARYDVAELPWDAVAARLSSVLALSETERQAAQDRLDPEELEDSFVLEWAADGPDDTGLLPPLPADEASRFAGLPEELTEQCMGFLKAVAKTLPESSTARAVLAERKQRQRVYLEATALAVQDGLGQYATTEEEDQALLAGGQLPAASRQAMAVRVRLGEKALLRAALQWTRQRLQKVQEELEEARAQEGPAAKRQRTRA
ncbi:hypothetical protein VTK73DRAFT_7225 [Phialemonium thermophilum]|uniref:SET domain-containing protein n=1 Tax=Phialemonium thermophilum TaxID=223376 RepID=A0ABR3WFV2_9PEZI